MYSILDRRRLTALIGCGALLAGGARAAGVDFVKSSRLGALPGDPYTPPTSLSTVADIYRRMTAPVKINGRGPYPFVVDTGANQSVISEELARELSLPSGPASPLNGVAGSEMAATTLATVNMGGDIRIDMTLSLLPAAGIGGAGMIGLDGLDKKQITLDFRGQSLRIESSAHSWRDPQDVAVKARRRDGQLTLIDADLANIPIVAFIDSGAQNTIGNMALRARALPRQKADRWLEIPILSATGQTISAEMADLPNLRVANLHLPTWPVAFADLHTFRMWGLTRQPAILLGVDVLSRFETVCLDFGRDEVRFHPPGRSSS